MKTTLVLAWVALFGIGCGKSHDDKHDDKSAPLGDIKSEAAVDFATEALPELDKRLASTDPGSVAGRCAVIKTDMALLEKAKPELAATVKQRCDHDQTMRYLAVTVDKAEAARAAKPTGMLSECTYFEGASRDVTKAGYADEPGVSALVTRGVAVCPK